MKTSAFVAVCVLSFGLRLFGQGQYINGRRTIEGPTNYCVDAGAVNAYACSLVPAITAYIAGTHYTFKAATQNTGAATLNINGLGALSLRKNGGSTVMGAGDIIAGHIIDATYDGTVLQVWGLSKFSGTATLGTATITTQACASVVTVAAVGVATTDVVAAGFNGDISAVTGYVPLTSGTLMIFSYPTAGAVNFKVCNPTASSITPGAVTLNWTVR